MERTFQHGGISLGYFSFGNGPRVMLAFHGFGSSPGDFHVFEKSLGHRFRVFSFSLPFHGSSNLDEETSVSGISPGQLQNFIRAFLDTVGATQFSLLGYSIGGKIVLKLVELFPKNVNDVILLAPDGIRVSPWYRFVTGTRTGQWVYRRLMLHPRRFMNYVSGLEKLRMVNPRTARFVKGSLGTHEMRKQVFLTWMSLRRLNPDIPLVQSLVNEGSLNLHLFFGRYDRIIPATIGLQFVKKLSNPGALHLVEAGHQLVMDSMNEELSKLFTG